MQALPVTIIIPTRNRARLLASTLPLYVSHRAAAVLVLDDASDDDTRALVTAVGDPRVRYHRNDTRLGLPANRNVGIRLATTDYVLMGEDDVIMEPEYLEVLWGQLTALPTDFAAGRLIALQRGETAAAARRRSATEAHAPLLDPPTLAGDFAAAPLDPVPTPFLHACSLFKRDWALRFPYDEGYRGNAMREETDFYLRCHGAGARLTLCGTAVAFHMFHDYGGGCRDSHVGYAISGWRNNHRFLRRHWPTLRERFGLTTPRWRYELRLQYRHLRMTFLFWMTARWPRCHAWLKRRLMG